MKINFFAVFYFLFLLLLYFISIPFLIFISLKKKYRNSIPARFFLINNPPFDKKLYYFHSCSLGETKALKPLIEQFKEINLSVITNTGYEEAKKYKNANIRFLPFEIFLPFWLVPCKSLVVMEAELWYMLFYLSKKRCKQTILLNARISKKSYAKYLKFRWFYKKIFKYIDIVLAQSEEDRERLLRLGAKNVKVVGNIKTYFHPIITKEYVKKKPLIILASTHKNEEELILSKLDLDKFQVAVAPRHPERFDDVYRLMKQYADVERLSGKKDIFLNKNLILIDKIGELINFYKIADIVILGGSFVDNVGGHNPVEAAYFNVPIISGKYFFNQTALYKEVEHIEICEIDEISKKISTAKPTKIKNRADLDKIIKIIKEGK